MVRPKYKPGCYLLNGTALIELGLKDEHNYVINLLYANPELRLALGSGQVVIKPIEVFEEIIAEFDKELVLVDSTKAEIIGMLYGRTE